MKSAKSTSLKNVLSERFDRDELVDRIFKDEALRNEAIGLMLGKEEPYAWRAAWVMKDYFKKHKLQVNSYLSTILKVLGSASYSHQRELLHIVQLAELNDEQEGKLFDICLTNWESICKKGSVRHVSFTILSKIIRKYPELLSELENSLDPEYFDSLSPGIRKAVEKQVTDLRKMSRG